MIDNFDPLHVPEQHLKQPNSTCSVCGGELGAVAETVLQENPRVNMVRCQTCHVVSAERMPTDEYISELYNPEHYTSSLMDHSRLTDKVAKLIFRALQETGFKRFNILDFGGNTGELGRRIRELLISDGYNPSDITITVVDLYTYPDEDYIYFRHVDNIDQLSDDYNVLVLSAVLEHLTHVGETFSRLLKKLESGAIIYGRTPYELPVKSIMSTFKLKWPRHMHDMGPEFWENVLQLLGYQGKVLRSEPSVVETTWRKRPVYTSLAHLLKLPSRFETATIRRLLSYRRPMWRLVGGWQVILKVESRVPNG